MIELPATQLSGVRMSDVTTLRVGGPVDRFVDASTDEQVVEEIRAADRAGTPLLVMGGGSNLLVGDGGFPGTVVRIGTTGVETGGDIVRAAAGEDWNAFVDRMVEARRTGVETLAGIPGRVGATPVQNVGAYGAEIAQTLVRVLAFDRDADRVVTLSNAECGFAYRHSLFKTTNRYVVLAVHFALPEADVSAPIRYAELARALGVDIGATAPLAAVRDVVLALRRSKGMVLDPADHDTWSAGSFFTNPILTAEQEARLPADAPRFDSGAGVKTSAAWLIERAGFAKGHGDGPARLSTKHTLALTNRGRASAADVLALARDIRAAVESRFGVTLVAEPVVVGASL
ncbi:MAG: murB [Frankiales bacterium]|nr:murB [Frankiales bacterium]